VGTITVEDQDFPWLSGSFAAEPGFARWAPLFAAEQELLDELSNREDASTLDRWERLHDRITGALMLVAPNEPVAHFLLHIEGDKAWFRWSND
jgi:hypothetical protein